VPAHGWQTISEKDVVRSPEPFTFQWAPTLSLEWLKLQSSNFVHSMLCQVPA